MLLDPNSSLQDTPVGKLIAEGKGEDAFQPIITSASVGTMLPHLADPEVMAVA